MGEYYDTAGNFIGVRREFITVDKCAEGQLVQYHGPEAQESKADEELLELAAVIIKDINKHERNKDCLYEELADVEVMLEQLMLIYDIDLEGLQQEVNRKIERTFDRMTLVPDCGWK